MSHRQRPRHGRLIWSTAAAGLFAILLANDTAYAALRVVGGTA